MASGTRLFVGNLPTNACEDVLRREFSTFGNITNLEIKSKPSDEEAKKFAFVTLSASNIDVESCIKHFSYETFLGNKLYVTRARESFLERLERERQEAKNKEAAKQSMNNFNDLPKNQPVMKINENLNPKKRKFDSQQPVIKNSVQNTNKKPIVKKENSYNDNAVNHSTQTISGTDKKKMEADKKRLESIKRKRQEFKEKQQIIKTGLGTIDKVQNKKVIFADNETDETSTISISNVHNKTGKGALFDDDESGDEVNFDIKPQYEGKKGQKVLELQSKFKSDKRFMLDKRFIDDDKSDTEREAEETAKAAEDEIVASQVDEKDKQLNILQDVLGVAFRSSAPKPDGADKKKKSKMGMLRFDPLQPEHSKFLAPVEENKEPVKKTKKKKNKDKLQEEIAPDPAREIEKVEASKEQFYKVSETLKEAIAKPNTFSLRSLFGTTEESEDKEKLPAPEYIPLQKQKESKIKNPLDPGEKNPFQYDSSESEDEEKDETELTTKPAEAITEVKAVWKENLFFSDNDHRFVDGLEFFNKKPDETVKKDRREMKSVMKKRLYNKGRKEHMFKKKIGGKRKSHKKSFRRKQ